MGKDIVQIKQMGDALRSSGYKSIDSAVAELIDNSIEAGAHDIFIIMREHVDPGTNRKAVYEFGILDNGSGMDTEILSSCLGIGFTMKSDRKGIGRFGVGLPQASLYVTPNVEVYSWTEPITDYDLVNYVWLDIDKVKTGEQTEIEDPVLTKKYLVYRTSNKQYDFTKHGTLVYWKNCDTVKPKTMSALNNNLEFALGRKFRHLIINGTHNIRLITIGHENNAIDVLPNDPLFLMKPNYVLGNLEDPENISERYNINCTEPIFEPYGEVVTLPVDYVDKLTGENKTSNVLIKFSKVRAEFYDQTAIPSGNPGHKPIGKYVKKLEGISVIRANREIDFGVFDFYEKTNNPYHRWWGCEISFDPVLDEIFGVANNKQQVELKNDMNAISEESEETIWDKLNSIIHKTIDKMVAENRDLRKGSRTTKEEIIPVSEVSNIVTAVENGLDDSGSETERIAKSKNVEEIEQGAKDVLISMGLENPNSEQIREFLMQELRLSYKKLGKFNAFFDVDFSLGRVNVTINTAHIFYNEFIEKMGDESKLAFELFIAALAKALDLTYRNSDQNDELLQQWDYRLKTYLQQIKPN